MNYALGNIETLIQSALHPDRMRFNQPSPAELEAHLNKITEEKDHIHAVLVQELFNLPNEKSIEISVQAYQLALINLADDATAAIRTVESFHMVPNNGTISILTVYRHTIQCAEELLIFISRYFDRFLNIDERIPEYNKAAMQSTLQQALKSLAKQYKSTNLDPAFLDIMLAPLRKFAKEDNSTPVTYRQLFYIKTLQKEYAAFLQPAQKEADIKKLLALLIYLNFNNYYFINYFIEYIKAEVSAEADFAHQVEKLAWWLKIISQSQTKTQTAYNVKDPSVKEQLIGWLADEISFMEKKNQLYLFVAPPLPTETGASSHAQITTSLSVKQIALFCRLLVNNDTITNKSQTALLNRLAEILKTEKTDIISAQSLRTNYYNIDDATIAFMKDMLIGMINELNKIKNR